MRTDLFDFELPPENIALRPASPRDSAKMLVVQGDGVLRDRHVSDLPQWLEPGDQLVVNDTRVIPAQLKGRRIGRETASASTCLASDSTEDPGVRATGCARTVSATSAAPPAASRPEATKPARQPCHSTSSASGLADSSMPVLPTAWINPDHKAKRGGDIARAA